MDRAHAEYGDVFFTRPSVSPTLLNYERWWDGSFWGGYTAIPNKPAWNFPSTLENSALIRALNKLKDQKIHLGVALAEAGQTIKLLEGAIRTVAAGVSQYRRSSGARWSDVKRWERGNLPRPDWKNIPNSWLQLQYGWKPLLSDLYGAMAALDGNWRRNTPLICVRSRTKLTQPSSLVTMLGRYGSKVSGHWDQEYGCYVSLWYVPANLTLALLSSLGLINPAEIVWEKLKYSFVVDWFLPIGPWLSSLTADVGFTFKGGTCSRRYRAVWIQDSVELGQKPGFISSGGSVSVSAQADDFLRSVYSSSPVPGLYFKNPLTLGHVANAMSLLIQAFK